MKTVIASLIAFILLAGIFASMPVAAQDATIMTDDHIAQIKNGCPTAIATLNQIHANDAPVYVNRNQAYFSISDKLIARLNGRLALNRYDTSELVTIASEYTTALTQFRLAYKQYDDTMAEVIRMNCTRQPVGFYDKISEARALRGNVNESIKKLHTIIDQYRDAVNAFKSKHATQLRSDKDD